MIITKILPHYHEIDLKKVAPPELWYSDTPGPGPIYTIKYPRNHLQNTNKTQTEKSYKTMIIINQRDLFT